jgi:hypothetical protein
MATKTLPLIALAAGLTLTSALPATAGDPACTVPGVTVVTDPAGDDAAAPATSYADIVSLAVAESGNNMIFTYKMSDLATLPPDTLWIVRFVTDVLPADGHDEYWVGMLTGPDSAVHFVYGTDGRVDGSGGSGPGEFTPTGELDPTSTFNADGTITLVLDKTKISGLGAGQTMFGLVTLTTRITPTDGTQPFFYGFRSVGDTSLTWDDTDPPDDYTVNGCGGDKSGLLGLGAMPAFTILFGLAALVRRRAAR